MVLMKKKPVLLLSALLAATALALTACGAPANSASTEKITVTASAYPLAYLTERIVGNAGTVTNLTPPGTEPHDLELTAQQISAMAGTDAVVYIPGFQSAVDSAIAATPPKATIDVTKGISMIPAAEADGAEEGDAHPHGANDPHVWLSPANMVTMAQTISSQLSTAKPALASTFQTNAKALIADLEGLNQEYKTGLSQCQRKQFITSHAAFAYLARDYGLTQISIAGLDPTQEPTAARIAQVQKLAKQYGVTTIFFETLVSPVVAKSIAGDLGIKAAVLDPIEGITKESAGSNYLEVMKANLKALQEANGCTTSASPNK